jgi:succinate-acetate transporter protein
MTHATNGASVATAERYQLHEQWTKAGPVVSHLPEERVFELQEVAEASVGDPAPMGLFGFAVGTLLVAIPIAGIIPLTNVSAALPTLLVFAGLAQFVAGMVAYRKGNTFAATAFCSFGANNVVVSTFFLFRGIGVFGDTKNTMLLLGIDLICFGYIAFMLMIAATRVNAAFVLLLLALFPGYALAGINDVGAPKGFGEVGGWFLIISAGLAFYCAGALVLNSTFNRTVLPMFSRA